MSLSVFNIFHKVLLEKNYSYLIPQDKELLLYDFYMLVHLNALDKEGRFEPGDKKDPYGQVSTTPTRSMGLSDSTKFSFEEIKKQVMDYLQPELLEASLFSISCEIRHVFDGNTITDIPIKIQDPQDFFRNFKYNYEKLKSMKSVKRNIGGINDILDKRRREFNKKYNIKIKKNSSSRNDDYQLSYKAVKRTLKSINMSEIDFVRLAGNAFLKLSWAGSYGGKPWASICDAFQKLYYAKREVDKIIYIDNMYHQQHNTDTVFNKLGQYYKKGYGWVLTALNFKADVKDNWDRIERIRSVTGKKMRNIDKMYIEMLKASGDKTWQEYYKIESKTDEQKKLENEWMDDLGPNSSAPSTMPSKLQQKYHNLAKEGISKFHNHFKDGYVYMGKGIDKDKSIEQDLITTIPDLIDKYGYKGLHLMGLSGNMSDDADYSGSSEDGNYFLDKKTWEKIFGPLPSEDKTTATNTRLDKFKQEFINYAKHGVKNMSNILEDKYVYMGKGSEDKSIKDKILEHFPNIHSSTIFNNMRRILKTGGISDISETGYAGSIPEVEYVMDKRLWEEIFGPVPTKDEAEQNISSGSAQSVPADLKKEFQQYAKHGIRTMSNILRDKYVYVGTGTPGPTIKDRLRPFARDINMEGSGGIKKITPYGKVGNMFFQGTDPASKYALDKDMWEHIFGPLSDIITKKDKELLAKLEDDTKQVSFDTLRDDGLHMFPDTSGILAGSYIYIGKGVDVKNYLTSTMSYPNKDIYYSSPYKENKSDWSVHAFKYPELKDEVYVCVDRINWNAIFKGKTMKISSNEAPTTKPEDKESNKSKILSSATIEHYKNLARVGKSMFNDSHVTNMNVVYIGHGSGVVTAIKNGILPYNTDNDKEAYGKWLTTGKWERLTSLSDISFAYDVWMMNYQWVALFGPISDLNSEKKEVPAVARAKFRKVAKEYLEAGKFYHNDKNQRLILLGDGSTLDVDADITSMLTSKNIYGTSKGEDDNEIYLMKGMAGNDPNLNYFTTEDKWEELFGPLPQVYSKLVKPDRNKAVAKVDDATKDDMISWAMDGYNYKTFQHITNDYVYLGNNYDGAYAKTDSTASKISKMGYTIYTYKFHHQEYVESEDVIPLSGVIDDNLNDFLLRKDDWIKITGELPPPNLKI